MQVETGRVIERYVVEGPLGSGGMASVYLLRHRHLGTLHALKVLTSVGANAQVRLMLEGRVQAALRHPNVVAVTDVLEVDGVPGLLMEYVPPPSLAVWLAEHHPTVEEAESLFRGIVEGVRHAHRYGLVHRDLKPSNVLLARYDGEGLVAKVADFGLAKLLTDDPAAAGQTRSGLAMGTPQYMAPEQVRDAKKVDRRADLYSLGCILYELLAGRPPFEWSDFITLYTQVIRREYAPLPEGVPARLVETVEALLEPDRDRRVPDCESLLALLDGKGLPAPMTVSPDNLGRLVDVPMLRDRVTGATPGAAGPPGGAGTATFTPDAGELTAIAPSPASPTLAAEPASLVDAGPIDQGPRPVPMPEVRGAPPTMIPEEPVRAPGSGWRPPAIAAAIALVGLGVGWALWTPSPPAASAPAVPVPAPAPAPAEVAPVAAPADPAPGPEPARPVAREARPAAPAGRPASKPEGEGSAPAVVPSAGPSGPAPPVEAAPAPAAPPPVANTGRVEIDADSTSTRVEADGAGGRIVLPADLPPGSYTLYAWFPDAPNTRTRTVTVAAGQTLRVRCVAFSMSCVAR